MLELVDLGDQEPTMIISWFPVVLGEQKYGDRQAAQDPELLVDEPCVLQPLWSMSALGEPRLSWMMLRLITTRLAAYSARGYFSLWFISVVDVLDHLDAVKSSY